jgi:hypothetical protein
MAQTQVTKSITAQNTFTDVMRVSGRKILNLSITSTALNATVVVQRRRKSTDAWGTLASFTANAEKIIKNAGAWEYRVGVPTGSFTSATALVATLSY